jgi:nucleoside-diphosphate-sugar epimerase
LQTYPPQQIAAVRKFYPWVDDDYDKIPVERVIMSDPELPGTICRLPMIYGPGDPAHRFFPILRRIADQRPAILFAKSIAAWKAPRGYVENVAAAIALAAVSDVAAGRIYNVGEMPAFSELDWARKIAKAANWPGDFAVFADERTPKHLLPAGNFAQHWEMDSSKIRRELGYNEGVPVEDGISKTTDWELENLPREFPMYAVDYAAEDAVLENRV